MENEDYVLIKQDENEFEQEKRTPSTEQPINPSEFVCEKPGTIISSVGDLKTQMDNQLLALTPSSVIGVRSEFFHFVLKFEMCTFSASNRAKSICISKEQFDQIYNKFGEKFEVDCGLFKNDRNEKILVMPAIIDKCTIEATKKYGLEHFPIMVNLFLDGDESVTLDSVNIVGMFHYVIKTTDEKVHKTIWVENNSNIGMFNLVESNFSEALRIKSLSINNMDDNGIDIEFQDAFTIAARGILEIQLPMAINNDIKDLPYCFMLRSRYSKLGLLMSTTEKFGCLRLLNLSDQNIHLGSRFITIFLKPPYCLSYFVRMAIDFLVVEGKENCEIKKKTKFKASKLTAIQYD